MYNALEAGEISQPGMGLNSSAWVRKKPGSAKALMGGWKRKRRYFRLERASIAESSHAGQRAVAVVATAAGRLLVLAKVVQQVLAPTGA